MSTPTVFINKSYIDGSRKRESGMEFEVGFDKNSGCTMSKGKFTVESVRGGPKSFGSGVRHVRVRYVRTH